MDTLKVCKKNKLRADPAWVAQTDLSKEQTWAAMEQIFATRKKPTAVIAFNDYVALDAIKFARSKGMRINKDIFFVSYANLPVTTYLDEPPIASVEQFPYEQASRAAEILLALIQHREDEIPEKRVVMQSEVIVNENNKE